MTDLLRRRLAREESGFTLIELLVVIIILGILLAIAIPSYLSFRTRANSVAAKSDIVAAVPAIQAYNADNGNSGYSGMTLSKLQSNYDAAIKNITFIGSPTTVAYCVSSTVGTSTWYKHVTAATNGDVTSTACTGP